ncbi:TPA: hypothetical protein ACPSKD_003334 [Legionella anisa]
MDESQVTIKTTGPTHPQTDAYACGDFTCAYSHKKMKELSAQDRAYNQNLITVLDSRGNKGDALRYASREESSKLAKSKPIVQQPEEEIEFSESEKQEFLRRLGQIVSDPNQIDKAVLEGNVAQIKNTSGTYKSASLRELDAYGVFNSDGSINEDVAAQYGIKFDKSQIKTRLESYGFKHLSLREMLIFESAIRSVINDLTSETIDLDLSSHQPSMGLAKQCFADFLPPTQFRLVNPLSMELTGPTRQMIGMGYFKFKETNISISPGPNSARSLTPKTNPELYEAEHDIARYLNNLLTNNVAHVFAMGRVFPYYPQASSGQRELIKDNALTSDFINYFIPDANGRVALPNIPELEDFNITSRPIRTVGRFITYEISINGSAPIQIHHFPLRDKLPLELTPDELAYVKQVNQTTLPQQNIHAHCRKGKGRSAQIAYLLASLNPKYSQLSHEERLAQMRAEKTPHRKPEYFIETDVQKDYIKKAGSLIQRNILAEVPQNIELYGDIPTEVSLEEKNIELYIVYGTLLKQEIDKHLQQIELSKQTVDLALLELMEKYQELSSTSPEKLDEWVEGVCSNSIITQSTITLFESIKNSTDFLLHAFVEQRNINDVEMFFDLQVHHGSYQDILDKLAALQIKRSKEISSRQERGKITPDAAQKEQDKLEKYAASFVSHIQETYLKNWEKIGSKKDKVSCFVEVRASSSEVITQIFDALLHHDPKTFAKEEFKRLQKEYYQYKPRINLLEEVNLLEKAKGIDTYSLDPELKQQSMIIEQLFALGYDHFTADTDHIIGKMYLIYEQLSELISANELSPEQWNALKTRYIAFKTLFDFTKPDKMETPDIFLTLDNLFQGEREHATHLFTLFKWRVSQVTPRKESLEEFVSSLGFAVLDTAVEDLPKKYYGDNADGIYSEKINQLLRDIEKIAANYKKTAKKGVIKLTQEREIPTQEEYEEAREQVVELISKYLPFLTTSTDFRVRLENLANDFLRFESDSQLSAPEFEKLKKRFAELKLEYQKHAKNEVVEQVIEEIEVRIKEVVEPDKEKENLLTKQYRESRENVLRIKTIKSGAAREAQDEIPFFESRIEKKIPKERGYLKRPKLIVFNIDEIIIELNHGEKTRTKELINVLNYAKKYGVEVALACSHTPSPDDEEQSPFAQLRGIIEKKAGIDISHMMFFLDTLPLHHEKATTARYFQKKIAQLSEQIDLLKSQIPTEVDVQELQRRFPEEKDREELEQALQQVRAKKEKLEQTIGTLQEERASLPEKLAKLTSDEFLQLDAIRHYHALRKPSNDLDYYQTVEGGILADFKNAELAKKHLGISELEKTAIWDNLFQLAEALMEAEYPQLPTMKPSTARPSLQTLLKELIYNADKPNLLQKKYGDLRRWEEVRQKIAENKEHFLQHIPQLEAFYHSQLAYRKSAYEKKISEKAVLKEEDMVFFDGHQNTLDQIHQRSNYRAIKIGNGDKKPFRHMVDLNYEMGAYNGVIAYLKGDEENAPKNYGPNHINKTLAPYLTNIPDFKLSEFQHSPIVLHLEMSVILAKLPELSAEEEVQQRYKEQFFEAAIERFEQLPKALQDDFVETYYRNGHQALKEINQELAKLISAPSSQLDDKLAKLQTQVDRIVEMDEKFSRHISLTFLSSEANLLRAMITEGLDSENLDHLKKVGVDKVAFTAAHDELRTQFYIESIEEQPDTYLLQKIHPTLEGMDTFDKEFITEQYTLCVKKRLMEITNENYASLKDALVAVQNDVEQIITPREKNDAALDVAVAHRQLIAAKKLCDSLRQTIVPYQNKVDELNEQPEVDYIEQISALSEIIAHYQQKVESSPECQAKLFLDKAEKYLCTKNWDVGFQLEKHTIRVGDKVKKIPATVAEQLKVIKEAREDGNYLDAKTKFLDIGKQKELSWRSSKVAKNYYSLFKKPDDESIEKDLNSKFSPTSKT